GSRPDAAATVFATRAGLSRLQLRFASAEPDAERAYMLAPNRPEYGFLLARTLTDRGDRSKGGELLQRIIGNLSREQQSNASDTILLGRAKYVLGFIALADNRLDDADRLFREANEVFLKDMKAQPAYAVFAGRTFIRIGSLHEQRNEMDQAEVAYRKA